MKNYEVVLASEAMRRENIPTYGVQADRVRTLQHSIEFYRGDEKVAHFERAKIVGWYERL